MSTRAAAATPSAGSSEVTLNLDAHRPLAHTVTVPLRCTDPPTCTVIVASIPTFMALQEALQRIVDVCSLDSLEAVRVTVSAAMATYEIVCRTSSPAVSARLHAVHHLHRVSTLSTERLVVNYVDDEDEMVVDSGVAAVLFPYLPQQPRSGGATSVPLRPVREESMERIGADDSSRSASGSPRNVGRHVTTPAAPPAVPSVPLAPARKHHFAASGSSPVMGATDTFDLAGTVSTACSICLEPLGPLRPVIALPCGHCFDLACFVQVEEGICPLCRFNISECSAKCAAERCDASHDLWLCLVCGEAHCGKSANGHMRKHFMREPTHRYAMQVGGLRVWDLARDALVHRIVATSDGGLASVGPVQADHSPPSWFDLLDSGDDEDDDIGANAAAAAVLDSRLDAIAAAYSAILQDQLAAQHAHFAALAAMREQDGRSAAIGQVEAAEAEHRRHLAHEYAVAIREAADGSLRHLNEGLHRKRQALKAAQERRSTAETTVGALRANVAKLRDMLSKQQNPAAAKADTSGAAKPATAADDEVQRLEQRLTDLYAQFD